MGLNFKFSTDLLLQPCECNHLDHILHSMKANPAPDTCTITHITEPVFFFDIYGEEVGRSVGPSVTLNRSMSLDRYRASEDHGTWYSFWKLWPRPFHLSPCFTTNYDEKNYQVSPNKTKIMTKITKKSATIKLNKNRKGSATRSQ